MAIPPVVIRRGVENHTGIYVGLMRYWIRRYANYRIAISRSAAEDLFGDDWHRDDRRQIVYSGRDFGAYAENVVRTKI